MERLREFVQKRNWEKYHTPQELARSLMIEAAELNRNFMWNNEISNPDMENVKEEIADIMIYLLYLSDHYEIDIMGEVLRKIEINGEKYPLT
jgi:NTP pyrophosphatase (non-canonical NTP hydrolase)